MRHAESTKNVAGRFGPDSKKEPLTQNGKRQAELLACGILEMASKIAPATIRYLYAGPSERASATVMPVANHSGLTPVEVPELSSFQIPGLNGSSEKQLIDAGNFMFSSLALYRAGLLNSYDLPGVREPSVVYEAQVLRWLQGESKKWAEPSIAVVVAHRSPLTALAIGIARMSHGYPNDFFGHVLVEYCGLIAILVGNNGLFRIIAASPTPEELTPHLVRLEGG